MASSAANTSIAPPPVAQERRHVQVIERQLGRARFHVKLVDFLVHAALLAVGALIYLLLAAIADHWLLPSGLGFTGRALAFVGLLALMAWFAVSYLAPLFLRGINPTYAARTIEEAQPSLKNSLINFLLLRQDRGGIREAVFEAVEQKAAADIAAVHVESAVDRGPMIRVGYVLVGVLALCAAYKILSPKDPFQSAARVALPWADIARPSRVQIIEVKPGSTKVYHGHTVPVTATIDGTSEDSPVWLIYSTADGQTVDRRLRMKSRPGGIQFEAVLPPEEETSLAIKSGLQQDVTYRVEAGDAVTEDFRLTLVAAPTIVVQQLEYEFPAYTKKLKLTRDKQGDIQALEGTKVTIHAAANQPIESAYIELDPDQSPQGAAEIVPLQFDGQRAWGTITLQLGKDRRTPWHTSYQVRFVNGDGNKSEQPIRHQIDVLRDLPPEVQFLRPSQKRIELAENGSLPIEVRAIDPDFGLTTIALRGEVAGKQVVDAAILKDDGSHPPQSAARYLVRPQELGLKAGDELLYHAAAADNRTSASGEADPNVTTTGSQLIVIVPPQEQPPNEDMPPPDGDKPPMEDQKQDGADGQPMPMKNQPQNGRDEKQPQSDQQKTDQPKDSEQQPMEGGAEKQGEQGQKSDSSQQDKGEKGQGSGSKNTKAQKGNQGQKAEGQKAEGQKSEGQNEQEQGEGSSESANQSKGQPGGGQSGEKSAGSPQQENPTDGAAGEKSAGDPSGSPSGNADQRAGQQGDQAGDDSGDSTGASSQPAKPAHEGDAIEQILKHRQQKEQEQSGQPRSKRDGEGQPPPDAADAAQENDPQTPMQGEKAGQEQPREGAGQKSGGEAGPKSPDGTKGAKGSEKGAQKGSPKGAEKTADGQGEKTGEKTAGEKSAPADKNGKTREPAEGQKKDGQPKSDAAGDKAKDQKQGAKPEAGEKGAAGADQKQGAGDTKDKAGGEGGDPQGPMKRDETDRPQPEADAQGEPKEPGMSKSGESGAGQSTKNEKGSGDSQEAGRDRDKKTSPDDNARPEDADPSTPSGSKRQSDSKGNDSGDRDGGGKGGAGQPSNQQGNDSAGKNSPGDEGAGAAQEKGKGPTGKKGGDQKKADGQTGAKGSEKGEGSSGQKGKGDSAGGGPMPPDAKSPDAKSDNSRDPSSKGSAGNIPLGGGNEDQRPPATGGEVGEVPDSEDANLDYAKKQTELALEHLKDQEHNPDPELLDRLGWTPEEMQEFIRRWEALQQAAAQDPKASRELDESLKSLGLRPPHAKKRAGGGKSDNTRDLRDSGTRSSAPKSYRDQFDNFRKSSR